MRKLEDVIAITIVAAMALFICSLAHAEPNYEALATAIRQAEGNSNYGVLIKYHHTTPRQACINTCRHKYTDYLRLKARGKATKEWYLRYLASKYAPQKASNDPKGLNRNWLTNVSYFYKGDT